MGIGTVTILFTDIQSSTAIWDRDGSLMQKALEVHNSILRRRLKDFNGYEVKTVGDAFMIAFKCPGSCAKYATTTQELLSEVDWPEGLDGILDYDHCSPDGPFPETGLRVRMGFHSGEV